MVYVYVIQWQSLLSIKQYIIMILKDEVILSKTWQMNEVEREYKE